MIPLLHQIPTIALETMIFMNFKKTLKPKVQDKIEYSFSKNYEILKITNLITIGFEPSKEPFYLTQMCISPLDTLTIIYKERMGELQQRGEKFFKAYFEDPVYSAYYIQHVTSQEDTALFAKYQNYVYLSSENASHLLTPFFNIYN